MGVYLPDMGMPKEGEHPIWIALHSDGTVEYNANKGDGWQMTTAVPVHPHGRLGDLDALAEKAIMRSEKRGVSVNVLDKVITAYDIKTAPTVIPAEEGE